MVSGLDTIGKVFRERVRKNGNKPFVKFHNGHEWQDLAGIPGYLMVGYSDDFFGDFLNKEFVCMYILEVGLKMLNKRIRMQR